MPPLPGGNWPSPTLNIPFVWIGAVGMWVTKNMIANDEYRHFRPDHDSGGYAGHSLTEDRQPAVGVSYDDAGEFCEWLTERDIESGDLNATSTPGATSGREVRQLQRRISPRMFFELGTYSRATTMVFP